MTIQKLIRKKNFFPIVILIFFLVTILPTFIRYYSGNNTLIGGESYYHLRAATILEKNNEWNPFAPPQGIEVPVSVGREYHFNPYHYILAYSSHIVVKEAASRVLPMVLGLLSLFIFNLILRKHVMEAYKRKIILIMLIISPAFIYTFTISNANSAAVFFTILGYYLFTKEKTRYLPLSILCFLVVALFSIFNTLVVGLLLLAHIILKKKYQGRFIITVMILAIILFAKKISFYHNYTYAPQTNILGNLISDLGGVLGFGIFTLLLAAYGIYTHWGKKEKFSAYLLIAIPLMIALFYVGNIVNIYLAFLISIAAGLGLVKLIMTNWDVRIIKNVSLLIITCGLLFSAASYMTRIVEMEPQSELIDAVEWMQINTFKDGFVLTDQYNGYIVTTISRNPVLADSYLNSNYNQKFVYKLQESMFYTRKLDNIKKLFSIYNVKHILIDNEMKEGKIWNKENEGLRFLLTNKNTFEKVYDKKGVEIWEVKNISIAP